jgi:probable selenium-dependent hydroxylase accessory protein YqeC
VPNGLIDLLADRELVAFVGAGGKTTLMLDLAEQLTRRGQVVVVTTTTKLSAQEVGPSTRRFGERGPVMLVRAEGERKVTGPPPDGIDRIFRETSVDYLLVEADGAQRRPIKAPAAHEPVIPDATTLVVIVVGAAALGQPIGEVAHRPELVAALGGARLGDPVTPELVAAVAGHEDGGMRGVPHNARVVVTVTNITDAETRMAVGRVASLLADHPRIELVLAIEPSACGG